jgi:DNA-binding response OmpR family regulator
MISFLIVEYDEKLRDMYESLIMENYKNVHVGHAANGKHALEKAKEIDYTAIIVDTDIPLLSGAELYKQLKVESPLMATKTAFISSDIYDSDNTFIFEESLPHLAKPFTKEGFSRLISYVVSKEEKRLQLINQTLHDRKGIRVKAREECQLAFTNQDSGIIEQVICKTVDYSIGGLAIIYEEGRLSLSDCIDVSVGKLNIIKRQAKVAWIKHTGGATLSGLQWV